MDNVAALKQDFLLRLVEYVGTVYIMALKAVITYWCELHLSLNEAFYYSAGTLHFWLTKMYL